MNPLTNELIWFRRNYYWLLKWLDNPKSLKSPKGMQIFRNPYFPMHPPESKTNAFHEMSRTLLLHAVFSKPMRKRRGNYRFETMAGFLNKKKRLPTEDDKVQFLYFENLWFISFHNIQGEFEPVKQNDFRTTCKLSIKR